MWMFCLLIVFSCKAWLQRFIELLISYLFTGIPYEPPPKKTKCEYYYIETLNKVNCSIYPDEWIYVLQLRYIYMDYYCFNNLKYKYLLFFTSLPMLKAQMKFSYQTLSACWYCYWHSLLFFSWKEACVLGGGGLTPTNPILILQWN